MTLALTLVAGIGIGFASFYGLVWLMAASEEPYWTYK
jgi:hypothetical protein